MNDTARQSALQLAEELLGNIELRDISLSAVMLKCARLARLLNDENGRQAFAFEAGGYPATPNGVTESVFELARKTGRVYADKNKDGTVTERMKTASIESLEQAIDSNRAALLAAADPNVSISSSNPNQHVMNPIGNSQERSRLTNAIFESSKTVSQSRTYAYEYVAAAYYELQFARVASSIFDRISEQVGLRLIKEVPQASQKTSSISENLQSENPEDWSNAVHSCRRLLQDVADVLYPATEPKLIDGKTIKLGADNYINRLVSFVQESSQSERFEEIVGSTLSYIGERLDAVFRAAQKGSHSTISSRDEAERYVIYTYMTVGDILALKTSSNAS